MARVVAPPARAASHLARPRSVVRRLDRMGAVRFCTANLLRRRLVGLLAIAALIGLAGAVTLAAFAGARRTETAYPRLLDHMHALDVLVSPDFGETVSVATSWRRSRA